MIELEVGTKLKIEGNTCMVVKSSSCKQCFWHQVTKGRRDREGFTNQCGAEFGNLSDFLCDGELRSDGNNVAFKIQ